MKEDRRHVAVVGTGMAGLVTAYLLHHDPQQRFRVRLMDKRDQVSLSAESVAVPSSQPGEKKYVWADVPMRAFAGGFYENLGRMYDYLGVRYHSQPFLFGFSRLLPSQPSQHGTELTYMVHASNFHQLRALLPHRGNFVQWALEAVLVLLCYLWFAVCCFFVAPIEDESLGEYLHRIYLPRHYNVNYLLPLMSSVCTCSHEELLRFPAADVLEYKKRTHRQPHYVVTDGVHKAQETLLRGLDVRLGVSSIRVTPTANGVELTSRMTDSDAETTEVFDLVVLAVSPDIVAQIFEPLASSLRDVPTTTVTTVAHTDHTALSRCRLGSGSSGGKMDGRVSSRPGSPQHIYLRSNGFSTESVHAQPNSILVTTNPLTPIDPGKIIRSASFTRVLRSPQSRRLINRIFNDSHADVNAKSTVEADTVSSWRNGDGGVYLAGGWCWDDMVLLEGCIVSAMRVAVDLGVEVPWAR